MVTSGLLIIISFFHVLIAISALKINNKLSKIGLIGVSITVGLWTFLYGLVYSNSLDTLKLTRLAMIPIFFTPGFLFLLISSFSARRQIRFGYLLFISCLFISLFFLSIYNSNNFIYYAKIENGTLKFHFGKLYSYFIYYFFSIVTVSVIILTTNYQRSSGLMKKKIFIVFLGFLYSTIPGLLFAFILPAFGISKFNYLTPALAFFFTCFFWISLYRYDKLFNSELISGLSIFFILFLYLLSMALMNELNIDKIIMYLFTSFYVTVVLVVYKRSNHLLHLFLDKKFDWITEFIYLLNKSVSLEEMKDALDFYKNKSGFDIRLYLVDNMILDPNNYFKHQETLCESMEPYSVSFGEKLFGNLWLQNSSDYNIIPPLENALIRIFKLQSMNQDFVKGNNAYKKTVMMYLSGQVQFDDLNK